MHHVPFFESRPGIESWISRPLVNTLTIIPVGQRIHKHVPNMKCEQCSMKEQFLKRHSKNFEKSYLYLTFAGCWDQACLINRDKKRGLICSKTGIKREWERILNSCVTIGHVMSKDIPTNPREDNYLLCPYCLKQTYLFYFVNNLTNFVFSLLALMSLYFRVFVFNI